MNLLKKLLLTTTMWLLSTALFSQDTQPVFLIIDYMKATPGKDGDYVKLEREVWKTLHAERKKQGLILGWYFYDIRSPRGTSVEYDYATVTMVQGWNKVGDPWGKVLSADMSKKFTAAQQEMLNQTSQLRNLVRTEVFSGDDYVQADTTVKTPAKFEVLNFMKVKPDMWEEYLHMETKIVKPMHVEMMKTGGRAAWGLYGMVMPGGESLPYDYVTVDFFNTWEDMSKGGDYKKALEKVHPGMSMEYVTKRINESRTMVSRQVWELIDYLQ